MFEHVTSFQFLPSDSPVYVAVFEGEIDTKFSKQCDGCTTEWVTCHKPDSDEMHSTCECSASSSEPQTG